MNRIKQYRTRILWAVGVVCLLIVGLRGELAPSAQFLPAKTTHTVCSTGCDFSTVQSAVNAAAHGDTVQLLVTSPHTENDIIINKSVTIEGLGETNTIVQAAAAPSTAPNRVFFVIDGLDVHLRDMAIRHGDTNSSGGGLHNSGSDVSLTNVHVRGNEASDGGGIYSAGGTLTLTNVRVFDNSVFNDGGGIYNSGTLLIAASDVTGNENQRRGAGIFNSGVAKIRSSDVSFNDVLMSSGFNMKGGGIYSEGKLHVIDSTIRYNEMDGATTASSFIGGGGIYSSDSELLLRGSIVEQNSVSSEQDGGGLFLRDSDTTIIHSVINNNRSDGAFAGTGGLFMSSGELTMRDTTVRDNWGDTGGGISVSNGSVAINHTTISGNESNFGGGLYVCGNQETMAFNNVSISDNKATHDGGGIYVCSIGELNLSNVTVSGNRADNDDEGDGDGGGIYLASFNQDSGIVHIKNTIISGNFDLSDWPAIAARDCFGEITSEGYNLIGTLGFSLGNPPCSIAGDTTGNMIGVNAMLDALADNGGPTFTHALLPGSVAINAGNLAGCIDIFNNPLPTDQRGGLRQDRCDIGAFEFGALTEHVYLPIVQAP